MTSDCHKELLKLDSVKTDVYIYIFEFDWPVFFRLVHL